MIRMRVAAAVLAACAGLAVLALLPMYVDAYYLALAIGLLQFTVLATAWGLFSGPTRYVSLATTAFFGVGAYTVAVLGELLALAAGAADRNRDRGGDGGHRGAFHVAAQRPALCDLHVRARRTHSPAGDLVRGQQDPRARPLRVRRHYPEGYLLAASRAGSRGVRDRLADRALTPRFCAAHHRRGRNRRKALRDQRHHRQGRRCSRSAPSS